LRLKLEDIVTYPKLNDFAFQEFYRMGVKIKGTNNVDEEWSSFDTDEEAEEAEEGGEGVEDEEDEDEDKDEDDEEEDDGLWESDYEEYTKEEIVVEGEEEEGNKADESFDSLSGECSMLCLKEWEKEIKERGGRGKLVIKKTRAKRRIRVRKKVVEVEGEVEGVFVSVKNDPRIGELTKVRDGWNEATSIALYCLPP